MEKLEYRPAWIEFNVADEAVPQILGNEFENLTEASEFVNQQAVALHIGLTVQRHMDAYEKAKVREEYRAELEDNLPRLEREHDRLFSELNEAKRKEKEAAEMVSALITKVKLLAKDVKTGLKEIKLDELSTFRIPYKGKYYFYTYMDKHLKLCLVRDITDREKQELYTAGVDNSRLFKAISIDEQYLKGEIKAGDYAKETMNVSDELKDYLNGTASTQEGTEEQLSEIVE